MVVPTVATRGAVAPLANAQRWLAPIVAIATVAALGGGILEGLVHGGTAAAVVIGCGEALPVIVPVTMVVLAFVSIAYRGWRRVFDATQGSRVLAALIVVLGAAVAVFGAGYLGTQLGIGLTRLRWLMAVCGGASAALAALAVLAIAPTTVAGATRAIDRIWPSVTPRRAVVAMGALCLVGIAFGFLLARALLARYDLQLKSYATGFFAGGIATGIVLATRPAAHRWLGSAAVILFVATWGAAKLVASRDPVGMIDAWAELPVGGRVIELRHEVGDLRGEVLGPIQAPAARTATHPDILLITIDTLRADRVTPALMPAVTAWASDSVVFERAYSPSTVTRSSVPSLLTGQTPGKIRGRLIGFATKLDPRHVLFAERLASAGYTTRGFLCCAHHFGGPFALGMDRGLEHVTYDTDGEHLADAAIAFFRDPTYDGAPRFAWLHTYEPHQWHLRYPAESYGTDAGSRYDRTVPTVDRYLAPMLAAIRERGRPTIVVFTSDHGEGLNQHGEAFHSNTPYTELIHVPLVISAPGLGPARITTPVGLVSVSNTILDLAGFAPSSSDGPSFAHLARGDGPQPGDGEAYSVVLRDRLIANTGYSLIAGDLHLVEIAGRSPVLFDLRNDPQELVDIAQRDPARTVDLSRRLEVYRSRDAAPPF